MVTISSAEDDGCESDKKSMRKTDWLVDTT